MEYETIELTRQEFQDLPEYSCSLPTGTTIGKRWKKNQDAYRGEHSVISAAEEKITGIPVNWWMGEYIEDPDPKLVGIKWRKIALKKEE